MKTHLTTGISQLESTCYNKGVIISYRRFYTLKAYRRITDKSILLSSGEIIQACNKGYLNVSPNNRHKVCFSRTPLLMTQIRAEKGYR
jgi:hypothetical protein